MATASDIDRLNAIVTQLTPLANIQAGSLIKAEDWNTVVNAILGVAQTVLAAAQNTTVPPHDHIEQVSLAWLTPALSAQIQRGAIADPMAAATVSALYRRVTDLSGQISQVNAGVTNSLARVSDLSTTVALRAADITHVQQTVQGLSNSQQDIADVRATLSSLQQNIATAVNASSLLTVNGQPVDLGQIETRLEAVEALKVNLTNSDGSLFTASAITEQIQTIQNSSVSQDQLTTALKGVQPVLSPDQTTALQQQVETGIRSDMQTLANQLQTNITSQTTAQLAAVNTTIAQSISDALPGVQNAVLGTIRPEIAADLQKSASDLTTAFQGQLATTTTTLQTAITAQTSAITQALPAQINTAVNATLTPAINSVNASIAGLTTRMSTVETKITVHDTGIANLGVQINQVAQANTAGQTQLQQALAAQQQTTATNLQNLTTQLAAQQQTEQTAITNAITQAQPQFLAAAQTAATNTANTATAAMATTLRGEMHQVAADQVATIQSEVTTLSTTVSQHIGQIATLTKMVKPVKPAPTTKRTVR